MSENGKIEEEGTGLEYVLTIDEEKYFYSIPYTQVGEYSDLTKLIRQIGEIAILFASEYYKMAMREILHRSKEEAEKAAKEYLEALRRQFVDSADRSAAEIFQKLAEEMAAQEKANRRETFGPPPRRLQHRCSVHPHYQRRRDHRARDRI